MTAITLGCAPAPKVQEVVEPADVRPSRVIYKHVVTAPTIGLLPPPKPEDYVGKGDRRLYMNPTQPYLDDLMAYNEYVKRHIDQVHKTIGLQTETIVIDDVACEVTLDGIVLPPLPKEPDLEGVTSFEGLYQRYYEYSEQLNKHLLQIKEAYREHVESENSECG